VVVGGGLLSLFTLSAITSKVVVYAPAERADTLRLFLLHLFLLCGVSQCCQVAESPAKKLKRGRRKKKLAEKICGRILAEFYQKVAEKGPQKIFKRSSLFLAMITTYNVHQDEIKFDF
jgi:hypothetical protein